MSPKKPTKFQKTNPNLRPPKNPRIRHIKPEFAIHREVTKMSIAARYAETYTWCHCDKDGRFTWDARALKREVLPYDDDVDFAALMDEWLAHGFCIKYQVGGQWYGQFNNWDKHQAINLRERESSDGYPPPDTDPTDPPNPQARAENVQPTCDERAMLQSKSKGEGVGLSEQKGESESQPTLQPNTLAGGLVDAPQDLPSAEPTPKPTGKEKSLWSQLREAYQEVYDANDALRENDLPLPTQLPKVGVDTLEGVLPGLAMADTPLSDVIAGWKIFVRDKYAANGPYSDAPIKTPIAFFFSDEMGFYIAQAKREAAQAAESARTVRPPRGKTAAEIASELFDTNAV